MREIDISDLAGIWFHDVQVKHIEIDYMSRKVEFECVIPVGFWNSPNRHNLSDSEIQGTLTLTGLLYVVIEPPDETYPYGASDGIEISSEGSATQAAFGSRIARLPQELPEEAFLHYFYVCEWNSGIFVAATGASFQVHHVRNDESLVGA